MNPLHWKREHQLGLVVAAIIGIPLGIIVGYTLYALGYGAEASSFGFWIRHPVRYGAVWWGAVGAVIVAGMVYMRQLLRV